MLGGGEGELEQPKRRARRGLTNERRGETELRRGF